MKIKMIASAIATVMASTFLMTSTVAAAGGICPNGTLRAGNSYTNSIAECNIENDTSLMDTVKTIINVIIGLIGLASVAFIIYGGFQYITSAGDAAKVKRAKDTILYSVIGLVVAILAFAIVNFVLGSFFS